MTTMRGLGSTTSYTGGSAKWEGAEDKQRTVNLKDLPPESQAAHEILKTLREVDAKGRARILEVAEQKDPVNQMALAAVAALFHRFEMPLNSAGIQRFKADRGLGSGSGLNPAVIKAYARSVNGGEVLFRVDRGEEANLRPADKACLGFLRTWSRTHGAEALGRLKEALDLGNPPVGADAAPLANEYVGVNTVREVSKASSMRNCPLTPEGMLTLMTQLEAEKATATTMTAPTGKTAPTRSSASSQPSLSPRGPTVSPTSTSARGTASRAPAAQPPSNSSRPPAGPLPSTAPRGRKD